MVTVLIVIHVLICSGLVLAVLLQSGKGSDMGAAFGGSSQTLFGSTGALPFLNKLTVVVAVGFMITSLSLAFLASRRPRTSVIEGKAKTHQEAPVQAGEQTGSPPGTTTEKK